MVFCCACLCFSVCIYCTYLQCKFSDVLTVPPHLLTCVPVKHEVQTEQVAPQWNIAPEHKKTPSTAFNAHIMQLHSLLRSCIYYTASKQAMIAVNICTCCNHDTFIQALFQTAFVHLALADVLGDIVPLSPLCHNPSRIHLLYVYLADCRWTSSVVWMAN